MIFRCIFLLFLTTSKHRPGLPPKRKNEDAAAPAAARALDASSRARVAVRRAAEALVAAEVRAGGCRSRISLSRRNILLSCFRLALFEIAWSKIRDTEDSEPIATLEP